MHEVKFLVVIHNIPKTLRGSFFFKKVTTSMSSVKKSSSNKKRSMDQVKQEEEEEQEQEFVLPPTLMDVFTNENKEAMVKQQKSSVST